MSTEDKTMGELVADMKDGKPVTWAQVNSAWTAEREALLKRARDNYAAGFAKGKEESDACLKPDPRWKERCEKCFENNACEPPECRYFDGEDCQSPIPNQHPKAQPGNSRPCNAHCDDCECEKNAGGVCRAPNPCLGYEDAARLMAELEAAKRELAKARAALSASPRKGKWKNGTKYEYEYAYCSECGHMQWAGWDTREQAKENIESFAHDYKFCPGCGAEMEGGVYVK